MVAFPFLSIGLLIQGFVVSPQAPVTVRQAPSRAATAEDALNGLRELAGKMEKAIAVGFGDGQHGRRLTTGSSSARSAERRIPANLRHRDRAVLLDDLKKWATEMGKATDRLQAIAARSGPVQNRRSARNLKTTVRQLRRSIDRLPKDEDSKPDPAVLKNINTSLARIPTHTQEWTNPSTGDPGF